jgi:hypothetical protein
MAPVALTFYGQTCGWTLARGERAYEEFVKAIHSGRLEAREGV